MTAFPWLPIGTTLPGGATSARLLDAGPAWQVCGTGGGSRVALLLQPGPGPEWWDTELAALHDALPTSPADGGLLCLLLPAASRPLTLRDLATRNPSLGPNDAKALGTALGALRRRNPTAAWASALFLPEHALVLATELDATEDRRATLVAALSGGVRDPKLPPERIASLNPRLNAATAAAVLETSESGPTSTLAPSPAGFTLPGQPALQALLRERVLDLLHRPADYARMGVPFPAGVLLAGPPGCGKSFAAARLAAFLRWPLHEISVGSVGSMWHHQTARHLHTAFDAAAAAAPAVVLLEELDALAKPRASDGGHGPTIDEVNTLLRLVEAARHRRLLVIGTTNRLDAIDPAMRRRGRFDHVVTMDYPDQPGVEAMLRSLLETRPHAPTLDIASAARRLARRPASDAAWTVDEAARLAVQTGHALIDDLVLARALNSLNP